MPRAGSVYDQALRRLFAARRAGIDFGLERIAACLQALGSPERRAPHVVQVAGTNGKGSTAEFVASILRRAGISVGVFSSPHLLTIRERFRIHGEAISQADFVRAYDAVAVHAATLTFFEQVTAMAAWLFADAEVHVAIYEVGLGGRLDSTTAIDTDVAVVTGIAIDHTEYLGNTLEEIASEKAGIFRVGRPAVIGLSASPAIRQLLATLARKNGSVPFLVGPREEAQVPAKLLMAGHHQRMNAACAIAVIDQLRLRGIEISDDAMRFGLSSARLAGRLEEVAAGLWIDGAHNAQGAQVLATALREFEDSNTPWVLVVGLSRPKEIAAFLRELAPLCAVLIATEARNDRAYPASEVADCARGLSTCEVVEERDPARSLERARGVSPEGRILVTGSLLLLGDVLASLGGCADSLLVSDPSTTFARTK